MPVPAGGDSGSSPPGWAPERFNVADYLPHRTLVRDVDSTHGSEDVYLWTWDETTTPPGSTVDRLIADGVSWVTGRVYPLHALSQGVAGVLVTLWVCAWIERGWPSDDSSLERSRDFEKRIDVMLADLVEANNSANDTGDYGIDIAVLPQWQFPVADPRYDDARYW